jgi:hypothetical protein
VSAVMGVIFLVGGFAAGRQMGQLKCALQSPAALREAFVSAHTHTCDYAFPVSSSRMELTCQPTNFVSAQDVADADESGALDISELANLAKALGSDLTPRQVRPRPHARTLPSCIAHCVVSLLLKLLSHVW